MRKPREATEAINTCSNQLVMFMKCGKSIIAPEGLTKKRIEQSFNRAQKSNGDHYRLK